MAWCNKIGTRLPIWNVQIESVGIGLMRRNHGLVGFWRAPSHAHRLVSSGSCRHCRHALRWLWSDDRGVIVGYFGARSDTLYGARDEVLAFPAYPGLWQPGMSCV